MTGIPGLEFLRLLGPVRLQAVELTAPTPLRYADERIASATDCPCETGTPT